MRPAAGVYCRDCLQRGHRCQAQIYVDPEPGELGAVALCLPCEACEPCVVDRVGGAPDPAAEEVLFEAEPSHVPMGPVIRRTAAELGLPEVLPADPEDVRAKTDRLAARREAGKLHAAVEARAKGAPVRKHAIADTLDEKILEHAGKMPDNEVGERLGISSARVWQTRKKHGIAAFSVPGGGRIAQVKVIDGERISMTPGVVMGPELIGLEKKETKEKPVKLKPEEIAAIQAAGEDVSSADLARQYGVSDITIHYHRRGKGSKVEHSPRKTQAKKSALALRAGQRPITLGAGTPAVDALLTDDIVFEVRLSQAEARRRMEQLTPAQIGIALRAVMQAGLQG